MINQHKGPPMIVQVVTFEDPSLLEGKRVDIHGGITNSLLEAAGVSLKNMRKRKDDVQLMEARFQTYLSVYLLKYKKMEESVKEIFA